MRLSSSCSSAVCARERFGGLRMIGAGSKARIALLRESRSVVRAMGRSMFDGSSFVGCEGLPNNCYLSSFPCANAQLID